MEREQRELLDFYCDKCERISAHEYLRRQNSLFGEDAVYSCLRCSTMYFIKESEIEKTIKQNNFRE